MEPNNQRTLYICATLVLVVAFVCVTLRPCCQCRCEGCHQVVPPLPPEVK